MPGARQPSRARRRRLLAATLVAALLPATAHAAVTTSPQTSSADFTGLLADAPVTAELVRNGIVIGRAPGTTTGAGALHINSLAGACWASFTPEVRAGDTIRVGATSMLVAPLSIGFAGPDAGGAVLVTGSAPSLTGLAAKLIVAGAPTDLAPAATTGDGWSATVPTAGVAATSAQASFTTGEDTTVVTSPAGTAGPAGGCSAALQPDAATVVDGGHLVAGAPVINAANAGQPLTVSGPTGAGDGPVTAGLGTAIAGGTATNHTWSAQFSPDQLAALPEGPLAAGLGASGATLGVLKDTVAPPQPGSSPPPGRYLNAPTISLSAEPGSRIHFTVDGSTPSGTSPVYTAPIRVGSSSTIRAFAVDAVGNAGPVAALAYQLGAGAGPPGGNPGGSNNPGGIKPGGTTKPSAARITVLKVSKRVSLKRLRKTGLGIGVQLSPGTSAVRFMVYRRVNRKGKHAYRLVASVVRSPSSARYRTRLNARALGLVRAGIYRLKVVPGLTRTTLDSDAARTIFLRVVR